MTHLSPRPEIQQELVAILNGRTFEKSSTLQRLLQFLVEHELAGNAVPPSEVDIATRLLNRRDFEATSDSIVRKTMARLRDKLSLYYAGEGRGSKIRILFERGSYRPVFPTQEHMAALPTSTARAPRVLLLPLYPVNFHDQNYLADGIWDDLITALVGGCGIPLIPPTTARYLRDTTGDMREYRRFTGADVILDGTVRQVSDSTLQITLHWVDGLTAVFDSYLQVRAGTYQTADAVQSLCEQISDRLGASFSEGIYGQIGARHADDPEARNLYLRAKQANRLGTAEGTRMSLAYLQRALELQPDYAAAHALMADTHIYAGISGVGAPKTEMGLAIECAQQALRWAPRLATALAAKGGVQFAFQWDFAAARKSLTNAFAFDPTSDTTHFWSEAVTAAADDPALAAARMEDHAEADNCSASTAYLAASYCYNARQWKRAEFWARKAMELNPAYFRPYPFLAGACLELGRPEEALQFAERARRISGPNPYTTGMLGIVLARTGRSSEARAVLKEHIESSKGLTSCMAEAVICSAMEDRPRACDAIARMIEAREPYAAWLHVFPFFQNLHSDSEFQKLLTARNS